MKSSVSPLISKDIGIKELRYAGFWLRALAIFLDLCMVYIPISILFVMFGIEYRDLDPFAKFCLVLFLKVTYGVYCGSFLSSNWQATPGKRAFGLYVINQDDNRLSFLRAFFRCTVGYFVSNILFGFGYIMVAFTRKKLALHDVLFSTYVVKK